MKPTLLTTFLILLIYVGSYVPLSVMGEYEGNTRIIDGKIVLVGKWFPKYCEDTNVRQPGLVYKETPTAIGKFYRPLVVFDRVVWHQPTKEIIYYSGIE